MSILISLAAEFTGKKAFKDADKNVSALEKGVKKLGKALAGAFAIQKVVAFGKAAAKAFMEDEKSAALLANTVKNLGLAFETPAIESFIGRLSATAAVADDELRPAMQKLLTTTGSFTKSQELLTRAIDISRGSGVDLATVVQDLNNAYVGNTKGLKKYNLGLTQAELKTASFEEVTAKLNKQFSGANAAYLNTYAGKMQTLTVAAGEAKEIIGKGLIDALGTLAGDTSVDTIANDMKSLAEYTADVIRGIGKLGKAFKINGITSDASGNFDPTAIIQAIPIVGSYINMLRDAGSKKQSTGFSFFGSPMEESQKKRDEAARKKAEQDAARRAKELLAAQQKNTAELKKQAALKKAQGIFDLEKIQVIAALQGKISEDEKLRLQLQLALLMGNDDYAKKLSEKLAASQLATGNLAVALKDLPTDINPFKDWVTDLDKTLQKLREIATFNKPGGSTNRGEAFPTLSPTVQDLITNGSGTNRAGVTSSGDVYVTVNGSVVSEQDLVLAIENGLQGRSLSGSNSVIGRISGMFG